MQELRADVLKFAMKMFQAGLTVGVSGNVSAIDRTNGLVAITPSGMDYDELTVEDVPLIDLDGRVVEGNRKPSTEMLLHLKMYQHRTTVNAVMHTHSTYATALAAMGEPIPVILAEVAAIAGGPIPVAPYSRFGTVELGEVASQAMGECPAVLLQNHGVVCVGRNVRQAFLIALDIEEAAKIYLLSLMAGKQAIRLDEKEIPILRHLYATRYGQDV